MLGFEFGWLSFGVRFWVLVVGFVVLGFAFGWLSSGVGFWVRVVEFLC